MEGAQERRVMAEYWFDSHDGLRLFSRVSAAPRADAPVVLCLHGLMRNSRDFEDLAPRLAARYRVVVPDVRGRGFSARDPNRSNYQISVYVSDLLQLCAGLGIERARIIGTSMGGFMAMVLGALQPQLVEAIILNDVGPEVDPRGLERIRGYAGKSPPACNWHEAVAQVRDIYGTAWPGLSDERWERMARRSYRANAHGVLEADADPVIGEVLRDPRAAALNLWPMWRALARVPMLAIRGAQSDVLSSATLVRMRHEKPDLAVLEVANRGHVPLLDEPECLAAIDEFLAAGGARGGAAT
jgi:pimeloyl-ACP methyl ester carboxylesterase